MYNKFSGVIFKRVTECIVKKLFLRYKMYHNSKNTKAIKKIFHNLCQFLAKLTTNMKVKGKRRPPIYKNPFIQVPPFIFRFRNLLPLILRTNWMIKEQIKMDIIRKACIRLNVEPCHHSESSSKKFSHKCP